MEPIALRRQRGFSLVELWVSILIIGTMAGLTLAAFQRSTQTERLNSTRDEFLEDLRTMHTYSVSGRPVVSTSGAPCSPTDLCGGYGLRLVRGQSAYTLFQDFDGDKRFDDNANEVIAPVRSLPTGIRIDAITYINCGTYAGGSCFSGSDATALPEYGALEIFFKPYHGSTTFTYGTDTYGQQVEVMLKDITNNRTVKFTVDRLAGGIRE